MHGAECHRGADLQFPPGFQMQTIHRVVGLCQFLKNPVAMFKIGFADFGQAEAARAAMQQANAQRGFQPGD